MPLARLNPIKAGIYYNHKQNPFKSTAVKPPNKTQKSPWPLQTIQNPLLFNLNSFLIQLVQKLALNDILAGWDSRGELLYYAAVGEYKLFVYIYRGWNTRYDPRLLVSWQSTGMSMAGQGAIELNICVHMKRFMYRYKERVVSED